MDAASIKIIAVICMTLDHLSVFLGAPLPLRYIGRSAAVIFFFCAAESAVHTHDRKKYLLRLYKMSLLMAGLSVVVPFILGGLATDRSGSLPPVTNNIFTELVPGVWIIDILESTKHDRSLRTKRFLRFALYQIAVIPAFLVLEMLCDSLSLNIPEIALAAPLGSLFITEGSVLLTLQIVLFYFWRDNKKKLAVGFTVYCALYALIAVPQLPERLFRFTNAHIPQCTDLVNTVIHMFGFEGRGALLSPAESLLKLNFQCFMIFALPILLMYNGKRGKGYKKFFYIYYPVHIYALYLIQLFVMI